jgi:hypothetical protein
MLQARVMLTVAIGISLASACAYGAAGPPEPPPGSYSAATFQIADAAKTMSVNGASISEDFLSTTKLRPMLGRLFVTEDYQARGTPVVLLGYDLWQRVFGGAPTIIGRVIQIDNRQRTVVGIMPKGFSFPKGAELWLPQ